MFYNFFHDNFRMKIFNTEEKKNRMHRNSIYYVLNLQKIYVKI